MSQRQNMDGQSVYAKQVDKLKSEVCCNESEVCCNESEVCCNESEVCCNEHSGHLS